MKLKKIYEFLDEISPFESQESWDNSGILIGSLNNEIKKIYVSLEATLEIADIIAPDSLLITHHPLIFLPLKSLIFDCYPSNIISQLISKNIALISMHTSFDKSHLNKYFAKNILGFKNFESKNIALIAPCNMNLNDLISKIQKKFPDSVLKITDSKKDIKKVAIVCGAGLSEISSDFGVDCVISGDIKYHDAMKFKSLGISLIDVGHYDSEAHFAEILAPYLKKIRYNAIILDSKNPFSYGGIS